MPGTKSNNPFRPRAHRYALEPRQMYDGAALVEAAHHHVDPAEAAHDAGRFHSAATEQPGHAVQPPVQAAAAAAAPAPAPAPAEAQPKEVYVVDQSVANWQTLVSQLPKGSQVVVIDDRSSGMQQLAAALHGEHDIGAIHIISHGASDSISLGTDTVTAANVQGFARELGDVGSTLTKDGDILVYGCNVSSHDTALVAQVARLTSADVASSADATGASARGGNWVLENTVGHVEARSLALDYDGVLEAPSLDTTSRDIKVAEPSTLNAAGADRMQLSGWTVADSGTVTVDAIVADTSKGTLASAAGGTVIAGGFRFTGTAAQAAAWLNQLTFVAADVELGSTAARTRIDVTVTDVATALAASRSVDVTITPSNDPVTVNDATQSVAEVDGGTGTAITTATLAALDPEVTLGTQTASQIVYSVTATPTHGYLTLNGTRLGAGSVFTQQDVIDGNVRYVHTATGADQNAADGFTARVNDGATPLASSDTVHITLNITPENQAPSVGGEGNVFEGQPANAVGTGNVGQYIVADGGGDPQDTSLTITITSLATHGTLYFNGVAVTVGQQFNYADRNRLTYSNDGVDGVAQDTFGVRVTDQGGGTGTAGVKDGTIVLHVQAVDDDPALIPTSTREATVTQVGNGSAGAYSVQLTPQMIGATDVDSPNENLSFVTNQAALTHGYLLLNGQHLQDGAVFTMADIVAGRVQYVQYAGATAGQVDTFDFQVVDNTSALRWNADGSTFTRIGGDYTGGTQADALRNYTFTIHLAETNNGNGGSFPIFDPATHQSSSTYAGVNPDGQAVGSVKEGDSILLHGTTTNGQPTDFATTPGLSYTADGVPSSQVVYTFLGFSNDTVQSSAGTLQKQVDGTWVDVAQYGTFTQADLDAGRVRFQHNGGENFHVTANFSVTAGITVISDGVPTTDTWMPSFDIYVTPVNDAPEVTGSSNTVIGEGEIAKITTGQLGIADPDDATSQGYLEGSPTLPGSTDPNYAYNNDASGADALKFIVNTLPTGGTLQYSTDRGATWHDVTQGMVLDASIITGDAATTGLRFVSNGSEVRNTSFTVEAVDRWGQHSATTGTVGIQITNVNDAPQIAKDPTRPDPTVPSDSPNNIGGAPVNEPLTLPEGGYAQITTAMLQAYDPDSSGTQVQYAITSVPAHGNIAISTDGGLTFHILGKGSSFTQADVAAGRIYYLNDGTEATGTAYPGTPDDTFGFTISDGDKEQSGNEFWIYTTPTNDAPTVSAPAGPVDLDSAAAAGNAVPGFHVADPDLTTVGGGETDYIQVTVRLLSADGTAFSAADYASNGGVTIGYAGGATVDADKNGAGDYLVLRGTRAQVNAALAGLSVTFGSDRDAKYQVQVIADDRLRDANGNLTSGANGGTVNQSPTAGTGTGASTSPIDTTNYDWYSANVPANSGNLSAASVQVRASSVNEPGVLTGPATVSTKEDQATYIGGGFVVSDPESAAFDTPVTVTLTVPAGTLGIGGAGGQGSATASAAGSRAVTITGDNSGTLTLTGRASDIQALLNDSALGLTYTSAANANHDQNGAAAGDVTLTLHFDDTGSKIGGDTGSGSQANNPVDSAVAIVVDAVNDPPVVNVGDSSTVYLNGTTAVPGFSIADTDITDAGGIATGEADFLQVTVRVGDANGNALAQSAYGDITLGSSATGTGVTVDAVYTGNHAALVIRGTREQVNAYLAGLQVTIGGALANADKAYRVDVIADDRLRDANGVLDGSGLANGGPDAQGQNGVQDVPTAAVDPYAAVPNGLTANVAQKSRTVFPTAVNNPTAIGVSGANSGNESAAGVYTLSHITLADPDAGTAAISATVTLPTGFVVHDVNGNTATSGTYSGAAWSIGTDASGHSTVSFTGTIANVQAALNAVGVKVPGAGTGDNNAMWNGTFQVQLAVNDNGNHGSRPDRPTLDQDQAGNEGTDPTTVGDQYGYADGEDGTSSALVTTRILDFTINSAAQVSEAGLVDADNSQIVEGSETFALFNDLDSVTLGNPAAGADHYVTLSLAQLKAIAALPEAERTIQTAYGTLLVTGYTAGADDAHGTLTYRYTLNAAIANAAGANSASEAIQVATRDSAGFTDSGRITVTIVDDTPTAVADTGNVDENGTPLTGNVVAGGTGGAGADRTGADATATPVTSVASVRPSGGNVDGTVNGNAVGQYGTLVLNADGSYTYTVDNDNAVVNGLKDGQSLTETYTYTITDADGDTSSTTLTITIHGHTDGAPSIAPLDGNGDATGHATVHESGLVDGDGSQTTTGSIDVSTADGLASITIGDTTVTAERLANLGASPVTIVTPDGILVLTAFDPSGEIGGVPTAGRITYTYTLEHTMTVAGTGTTDTIGLIVTDRGGATSNGSLVVDIVDDAPTAHADTGSVNEDGTALTGNVVVGNDSGSVPDRIGADVTATPVTGVVPGAEAGDVSGNVGSSVAGQYGTLVLNADGSYSYTVDNGNATVNALKDGQSLTDTYTYTITDADGDTSTTTLTITIHGHTDGAPSIVPVDGNGAATGHATVHESGLVDGDGSQATTGSIDVSAADGLASVAIGGTTLTTAQLDALSNGSPVTIRTPDGTLVLTGFTASAEVGGVPTAGRITYTYTLDHTMSVPGTGTTDAIELTVTDRGGTISAAGTLVVEIVDDTPVAHADTGSVDEDGQALTGNVVNGDIGGGAADRIGADTTAIPVTGVQAGTAAGPVNGAVGTSLAGSYGHLTLNADGSYSYTVDNGNATVNALKDGQSLTETYTYTITDGDGDTSTTTLTITIHGHTDGAPSIVPVDGNGAATGHATVHESGLVDGDGSQVTTGSLEVSAADGLSSVTIGGTTLTVAQLEALNDGAPVAIATPDGTLVLTGFQPTAANGTVPTAGTITYTYTLDHALAQPDAGDSVDNIDLNITDNSGETSIGTLTVDIVDDRPTANADTGDVDEDGAVLTGNVVGGTTGGDAADRVGADATATPVTGVEAGNIGGVVSGHVGAGVTGQYGTLVLNADGSYSYTVDNGNATVNALKDGQTLTETYTYTITDADGDTSTTTLTVTIHGHTDGTPSIVPVDGNGAATGHATVHESGLVDGDGSQVAAGTVEVSAVDGLSSVTIGGTTLTVAQLEALNSGTPVAIATPDGTLMLTGFQPTATNGTVPTAGTITYTYTLDHAVAQSTGDSVDNVGLAVTDAGGGTSAGTLVIDIVNDRPTANADTGDVDEDGAALTGNVVGGTTGGDAADRVGADATATPVTGVEAGNIGGAVSGHVGTGVTGQYGTLVLNADGSYSYVVDDANAAVNALKDGDTLTDTYTYTITDADGDTSTTTLTITIHGHTDGAPSIVPVDGNGAATGHATVHESGLVDGDGSQAVDGSIDLAAADGLSSVTIGGTTLTVAQLEALNNGTPVAIDTPDGTLVLTGFQPTATNGTVPTAGTITYTYTLDHAVPQAGTGSTDPIALTVTDRGGSTSTGTLVVDVVDDAPTAHADHADVDEDGIPVIGNVVGNGGAGDVADRVGADATATPVSGVAAGTPDGAVAGNVGSAVAGQYGTLVLNADGSYSYTVDNGNATVNALKDGQTLTDTYTYTITDADGDTSTTTLTLTIHGHTDGAPAITPRDGNGSGNSPDAIGDATVWESGLTPDGPAGQSQVASDTIAISAPDGLVSIDVGGRTLTAAELAALSSGSPVVIVTAEGGELALTGFVPDGFVGGRPIGGVLSYTYTLGGAHAQTDSDHGTDTIALSVTDAGGGTSNDSLVIDIVDDAPTARADQADANEDGGQVSGHVVGGGGPGDVADRVGADATATPVSGVVAGVATGPVSGHVGSGIAGQYGTLVLNADGSYSYAVDNANPVVNAMKDGDTLTETYTYTITDADGDTSTTTLTITIHGHTDGVPSIVPVDGNGDAAGHATVHESGLAEHDGTQGTTGTITVSAEDGVASVTIGGVTLTADQLGQLSTGHPATIHTPDGTLLLTGFQPAATNGSVPTAGTISYTYTLDHAVQQHGHGSVDTVAVSVTDRGGGTASGALMIDITNDVPTAHADTATIVQDQGQTGADGNVFAGSDRIGADGPVAGGPVTGVVSQNTGRGGSIGGESVGAFGTLVLNADGSYSYRLDLRNPTVSSLDATGTITEVFVYTITDADGDTSTATLSITIHGTTPPILPRQGDQIFPLAHEWTERDIGQTWEPGLFVLPDGVAFSQKLVAGIHAGSRVGANDFALDHSPLWDDFSPFAPARHAEREQAREAHRQREKDHAKHAAHAAPHISHEPPQVPVAIHVPPPASTPGGAPSLTARIAALAKANAPAIAAVPTKQPRH